MPEAGLPAVEVHTNVYGVVPPDPVAVNVTTEPAVPVVGPLIVTPSVSGLTKMLAVAVAVLALASATVTVTM